MKRIINLLTAIVVSLNSFSQSVGIGTPAPHASAQLDVTSINKGLLPPRMTTAQRNAIASPAPGLIIYQTDGTAGLYYYNGAAWQQLSSGSATNYWTASGSHIFTNNTGNVGIGVNPPAYKLDIDGRIRIRTGTLGTASTSSGMWLEDYRDGTNRIFFGMRDSVRGGFYGGGSGDVGWDFTFNANNGNVGIGADSPTDKLHVKGIVRLDPAAFGGARINMYTGSTTDNSWIYFYNQLSASSPSATVGYSAGNDYLLLNCGLGDVFIKDAGVGIETASPAAKLHVNGNVMIGSGTPAALASGYMLSVNGKIVSEEVRVEFSGAWPDYVFGKDYKLPSLAKLEDFIKKNKHLPNIPAAEQVKKEGFDLGDMNKRLLEKIEELALYIIQQDKKIDTLQQQVNGLLTAPGKLAKNK
jgi:hypothetical protein